MTPQPGVRPPDGGGAHAHTARRRWALRLKAQVPYAAVLLVAAYLFQRATQFAAAAPEGRIGPDVWPKAILGLAILTCCYAIARNLLFPPRGPEDLSAAPGQPPADTPAPGEISAPAAATAHTSGWRLLWGMGLTLAYAGLVGTLGFFLCTVLFLGAFTWLGGYRRPAVVATTSVVGGLVFTYVFMKIVYVSLPLGTGPFGRLSVQLLALLGIR